MLCLAFSTVILEFWRLQSNRFDHVFCITSSGSSGSDFKFSLPSNSRKKGGICEQICLMSQSFLAIRIWLYLAKIVFLCICCITVLPFVWWIKDFQNLEPATIICLFTVGHQFIEVPITFTSLYAKAFFLPEFYKSRASSDPLCLRDPTKFCQERRNWRWYDIEIAVEIYSFEILNNDDDFRTFFLVTCAFSRDLRVEVKTTYLYFTTFMASPTTSNIGIDICLSVLISLVIFEWYRNLCEIMNTGKYLSPKNAKQCLSFLFGSTMKNGHSM